MGAVATLQVHHADRTTAERGVRKALAEVRRLEKIFSLYREDSALVALNREGILIAPPRDLLLLLGECRRYWELTGGAFDPTVQALWVVYRDHFSRTDHDPGGPSAAELRAALDKVGFDHVAVHEHRIVLGRRGMGLTLNGIAQGYMTDRAIEILRSAGIERSLVDMGRAASSADRVDGGPWRIGIADRTSQVERTRASRLSTRPSRPRAPMASASTPRAASTTSSIRNAVVRPTGTRASP